MIQLNLPDADVSYFPNVFDVKECEGFYNTLLQTIQWQQDSIKVFGKTHLQPRLTALYGDNNTSYSYSNITMHAHPFTKPLIAIKQRLETIEPTHFNCCLLNYYRTGQDSNGWHADNEKELGENPIIASVSFGATRYFHLKHNSLNLKQKLALENGSVLLMKGSTQTFWKHQIAKTKRPINGRINLTFRVIK